MHRLLQGILGCTLVVILPRVPVAAWVPCPVLLPAPCPTPQVVFIDPLVCPPAPETPFVPLPTITPTAMPAADKPPTSEHATPVPAVPEAPKPERKSDAAAPKVEPPPLTPTVPTVPKIELPPVEKKDPPAKLKLETPPLSIPPLNLELPKKETLPIAPPLERGATKPAASGQPQLLTLPPTTRESNYRPALKSTWKVIPVSGTRPLGKVRVRYFNYSTQEWTLSVDGQSHTLPAKSTLAVEVADGFVWSLADHRETLTLPADSSGWQIIIP